MTIRKEVLLLLRQRENRKGDRLLFWLLCWVLQRLPVPTERKVACPLLLDYSSARPPLLQLPIAVRRDIERLFRIPVQRSSITPISRCISLSWMQTNSTPTVLS